MKYFKNVTSNYALIQRILTTRTTTISIGNSVQLEFPWKMFKLIQEVISQDSNVVLFGLSSKYKYKPKYIYVKINITLNLTKTGHCTVHEFSQCRISVSKPSHKPFQRL